MVETPFCEVCAQPAVEVVRFAFVSAFFCMAHFDGWRTSVENKRAGLYQRRCLVIWTNRMKRKQKEGDAQ